MANSFGSIGIDIVEVGRVRKAVGKNPAFLKRFFTKDEIAYCWKSKNKFERIAARFAAKEAVIKACGVKGIPLKKILIVKEKSGKPFVEIKDKRFRNTRFEISLSHTKEYACAVVVRLVGRQPSVGGN